MSIKPNIVVRDAYTIKRFGERPRSFKKHVMVSNIRNCIIIKHCRREAKDNA